MQPLPAWLKAPDTLGAIEAGSAAGARNPLNYIAATEAGASAGAHRASLETQFNESAARNLLEAHQQAQQLAIAQMANQREMERAKMEMDARQQTAADQALKEAQRIRIEGAYKDQQLGLQKDRIKQAGDVAAARAKEAAATFADQQGFASDVQGGMPPEKAIWNHSRLLTPGTREVAMKPIPPMSPARISQQYADSPVMQKEEQDTEAQIASGVPALKAIQDHPTLTQYPPFAQKWAPLYRAEVERMGRGPKSTASTTTMASQRKQLSTQLDDPNLPDATKLAYKTQIRKIDTALNGGVPPPPDAEAIAHLKEKSDDPKTIKNFNDFYGDGAADQYLNPTPAPDETAPAP